MRCIVSSKVCSWNAILIQATNLLDGSWEKYPEWKKTISKGHILYNSIHRILLKWQHYGYGEWFTGYQGLGGSTEVAVDIKVAGKILVVTLFLTLTVMINESSYGQTGEIWLRLDSVNINFLIAILYYRYARCYHCEKLSEGHMTDLCIIFCSCMWIYNYLKIKRNYAHIHTQWDPTTHPPEC